MDKRILFSFFCNTSMHIGVVKGLIEMLQSKGYSIDILSNQDMDSYNTDSQVHFHKEIYKNDYLVIIAFNLKGYNHVKSLRKKKNLPLIYTLCASDIDKEYLFDTKLFNRILLINDTQYFYPNAFPHEYTTNIAIPFELIKKNVLADNKKLNILVCTDNASLLKIMPVLNNHGEFHFTVISKMTGVLKKIINGNIDVVTANDTDIDEYILNSRGVIGSGEFILRSLQLNRPSIVAGPNGFGRLVSGGNIHQQFHSFFQGRVGAQYGEIIPFNLLSYEIERLMNNNEDRKTELKHLSSLLEEQFVFTANTLDNLIKAIILKADIWDTKLILSSAYYFIEYDSKSFVAVDSRMMKIHSLISVAEHQKIKLFESGITPRAIFNQTGGVNKNTYNRFIEKMKASKILVPYEE